METKRITTAFQEKALANSEEELCRGYMDCIDKLFEDCDSALEELGLGKCGYVSQVERNNEMIEDMIKLKLYVWSAHMEVYEKLDKPLFIAFKNGATQALSEIVLDDFETDNTIGMEKHNKVTGYLYTRVTAEVKKTLKISDFLGIVEVEPEDGYPVLENIETIGEFALLFREDYANMKSSTDINKKLQVFLEYGEYRHRMYHPEDDYLSGALDIIPLKPLMESFTGVDCITEEELTEFERMLKFSEAVVDIFTWGQAAVAFKAGGYVGKDLAKAIGASIFTDIFAGTTAYTVGYCSNMGGASPIASTVLSMMAGCSVSALNGRVFLDIDSNAFKGGLEPGTLSNVDARKWYLEQEAKIPDLIDDSLPLEQQARQAFELRNQYRMQARELMSDRQLAESLYATDPNLTWEQIIQKQIDKGLSGDDIYKAIIESSQRSRTSVNQSLGLE